MCIIVADVDSSYNGSSRHDTGPLRAIMAGTVVRSPTAPTHHKHKLGWAWLRLADKAMKGASQVNRDTNWSRLHWDKSLSGPRYPPRTSSVVLYSVPFWSCWRRGQESPYNLELLIGRFPPGTIATCLGSYFYTVLGPGILAPHTSPGLRPPGSARKGAFCP
jgi:hypothetical protein